MVRSRKGTRWGVGVHQPKFFRESIKRARPTSKGLSSSPLTTTTPKKMASKPIHEYDAKLLLSYWLPRAPGVSKNATVSADFAYPSIKVAQLKHEEGAGLTGEQSLPGWVCILFGSYVFIQTRAL